MSAGTRVRWLVVGAFHPEPTGQCFTLTEATFPEAFARALRGVRVSVRDRIGAGDTRTEELSPGTLSALSMAALLLALPDLRALSALRETLQGGRALPPEDAAHLRAALGEGPLTRELARVRSSRPASLALVEQALFTTARELLAHPRVARLESAWRGLHWLLTQCPPGAGMDVEVLDLGPEAGTDTLVEALTRHLERPGLERPDACFLLDAGEEPDTLPRLAALGEACFLPFVLPAPAMLASASAPDFQPPEAWARLRADEASRWLCAASNPVLLRAERHGEVRGECFASPVWGVAALLAASLRDTHTFARAVGPGSPVRAPAVWEPRDGRTVATEACLSLREQERLASRGVAGVSGFWDSPAVNLAAAPTVYGGRDAAPLAAQLLTGRIVRLAQELSGRLPAQARPQDVAEACARAAAAFLPLGPEGALGRRCELQGQVVALGRGERGLHVRAALPPELAGLRVPLRLELTLPLRG